MKLSMTPRQDFLRGFDRATVATDTKPENPVAVRELFCRSDPAKLEFQASWPREKIHKRMHAGTH